MLTQSGIFHHLLAIVEQSTSNDVYPKLIASTLNYSIDGVNRNILEGVLRHSSNISARLYGTVLLKSLIRFHTCQQTLRWLLQQLVKQVYDSTKQVNMVAVSALYELTETPTILAAFARSPPLLDERLGHHSQLLTARLLETSLLYTTYESTGMVDKLLQLWDDSFCLRWVSLQEEAICEAMTQHRRDESTGQYGRRSNASVAALRRVTMYPHLYHALVQHKTGAERLLKHPHLQLLIKTVSVATCSTGAELLQLKAAVWALCQVNILHFSIFFQFNIIVFKITIYL